MKSLFKVLCLAAASAAPLFAQTVDPCAQTAKLSQTASGVQTFTSNSNGNKALSGSPYGYEMWTEGGNNNKLMWFGPNQGGGAAFRTEWNSPNDYLGRVGYFMNQGKAWTTYKNMYADYNYTRSGNNTGGGYSYIGLYGWTKNPQVEWYIVEDWFGSGILNNSGIVGTHKGDLTTSDGVNYKIYRNTRPAGSGNILNDGQAFPQYFSIRQRTPNTSACGSIYVNEHFSKWDSFNDMKMGSDLYEVKFLVEAGGGTGWLEFSYLSLSQEDSKRGSAGGGASSSSSRGTTTSSSSNAPTQATTCKTPLITYPPSSVPSDPYTACFKHTNNKCYVCKVENEGEHEGNMNTCASGWVWDGTQLESNLENGYWYQEVPCPTGSSSSAAAVSSSSSAAVGSSSSSAVTQSSSSAQITVSSSSSEAASPIITTSHLPLATSQSLYYSLKGIPMGTNKPTKPGVYIEKHGSIVQKIVVR
jgi:hypothetical protein